MHNKINEQWNIFTTTENDPPAGGWVFHATFKKQIIYA